MVCAKPSFALFREDRPGNEDKGTNLKVIHDETYSAVVSHGNFEDITK